MIRMNKKRFYFYAIIAALVACAICAAGYSAGKRRGLDYAAAVLDCVDMGANGVIMGADGVRCLYE